MSVVDVLGVYLLITGFLLWLDSPDSVPRGGQLCGIRKCRWHR